MELDQFLNPKNSPFAINQGATTPYTFDYQNERGVISTMAIGSAAIQTAQIGDAAITSAKIATAAIGSAQVGTLSFNQILGGTATLGGTSNGNGLLSVKNSGGTEIVQINNNGISITGGSVSITNTGGSVIIDKNGIVSSAAFSNFASNSLTDTTFNASSMGTSALPVTNGTVNMTLVRPSVVLVTYDAVVSLTESAGNTGNFLLILDLIIGGVGDVNNIRLHSGSANAILRTYSNSYLQLFPAGTASIKLKGRWETYSGTPSAFAGQMHLNYVVFGT